MKKQLLAIMQLPTGWHYLRPTGLSGRGHQSEIKAANEEAVLATLKLFNVGPVTVHQVSDEELYVVAHVTFHKPDTVVENGTLLPITDASPGIRDAIAPLLVDLAATRRAHNAMNHHPGEDDALRAMAEFDRMLTTGQPLHPV